MKKSRKGYRLRSYYACSYFSWRVLALILVPPDSPPLGLRGTTCTLVSLALTISSVSHFSDYELDLSDSDAFSDATIIYDWKDVSCVESPSSSSDESLCIPDNLAKLTPRELRAKLESLGEVPGPITPTTHRAYLRYLTRILTGKRRDKPKVRVLGFRYFLIAGL